MHADELFDEIRIVWLEDVSDLPYVREVMGMSSRRKGPLPRANYDGRCVGYAELGTNAKSTARVFRRRAFMLTPNDPYGPHMPVEAVDPRSIAAGAKAAKPTWPR